MLKFIFNYLINYCVWNCLVFRSGLIGCQPGKCISISLVVFSQTTFFLWYRASMATRSPFGTLANLSIMATSFIAVAISYTLRYIELESEDIEVSTRPNKKRCVFRVTRPYLRFWSRPYFFSSCKKKISEKNSARK